ncbi:hypothetical protein ME790_18700 [Lactobacillus delbrueckii]|uniref:DUF7687 domain-containing protein n=1 Tax=Lactobacillus delbrueckii TaxID=1584 RepID=UPI001F1C52B6|nr:hypothetical protein [Lactobacillus delbrueckii]GHN32799.1 hypothetical protein ME790_18700 [Lactobacillus delbrueckii]
MKAFKEFQNEDPSFWAMVKFASDQLLYTERSTNAVKTYKADELEDLWKTWNFSYTSDQISRLKIYTDMRADLINNTIKSYLMTGEEAKAEFIKLEPLWKENNFHCKLPLNKQKGEMKQIAYFTAIINILAEKTIRDCTGNIEELGFDDDPHNLTCFYNKNKEIIGTSSRRFDGAYTNTVNPSVVWEIKEYYYNKTFGSRIADGVYETQLDGYEFRDLKRNYDYDVYHILFIDAYDTWWNRGKSYLCRLVDALNSGAVDEIIIGREVLTRWPNLLRKFV